MAQLVSITESAEAITAEAIAYVWEAYDAPRKRVQRARITEHRFTVSIPKLTEEAAPVAFVVEHFPVMEHRRETDADEYRAGYDEPIRYAANKFWSPVRMDDRHRDGYASAYESADPRERLAAQIESIHSVSEYDRERYADRIARHEIRSDDWCAGYATAERIEKDAACVSEDVAIIRGEVWQACKEPAYIYYSGSSWFRTQRGSVFASTDYNRYSDVYGAHDRAALACYHNDATRYAYIRVLMPELVTIDNRLNDLQAENERRQRYAAETREKIARLTEELQEREREADKARAELESYEASPRAYWEGRAASLEETARKHAGNPSTARYQERAAAIRRELARTPRG